jgi:HK97 family phage prohead protease
MDERGAAEVARAAGKVTNPGGTERLHEYWVHGKGAAKIAWGTPGDFSRCVAELGKYIHDPQGYCNLAHHAALGYYPATHAKMEHAGRADMANQDVADKPATATRAEAVFSRIYELEDIQIVSRAQGDGSGRLVEAYAAVFNIPAEIHDQHGDYNEENDPASFNRSIDHGMRAARPPFRCIYNHGMTIHGTPAERFSIPIGTPREVRAESRGLLTRTMYNETPLADEVLEAIKTGGITAQSYTGRIIRSSPELRRGERYRPGKDGRLPTVRRLELALREYGPTPFPAFSGAEILGVRMSTPGSFSQDPDEVHDPGTPSGEGPAAGDPLARPDDGEHSARYHQHTLYALRSREQRERVGLTW